MAMFEMWDVKDLTGTLSSCFQKYFVEAAVVEKQECRVGGAQLLLARVIVGAILLAESDRKICHIHGCTCASRTVHRRWWYPLWKQVGSNDGEIVQQAGFSAKSIFPVFPLTVPLHFHLLDSTRGLTDTGRPVHRST